MKRTLIIITSIFIVGISIFFINFTKASDKGRQYYEETGQIVWEIKTEEKIIALTFDDGPHPIYTMEIMDLLKKYKGKGTFFVVGANAEKNADVVYRMYEEGHEIANHTYTHSFNASVSKVLKEIKQTNEVLYSITGSAPTLFRPVEGQYTDALIKEVAKDGMTVVMWSWHQDTLDWRDPGVLKIVDKVMTGTKPGNVILFHDGGGNRQQTVKALEEILPALQKQGYRFVTISELLEVSGNLK